MIGEPDPSAGTDNVEAPEDAELGRALEAYLADIEAGRPADPARLIDAHPKIAEQLRACLQVMNLADRMVSSASSSASGMGRPIARLDSTTMNRGQSGLTTCGSNSVANVHLRDLPDESEPLIQPRSTEMPMPNRTSLGRYQLQGEIARGGMGAILKGRDVDLGRDLALKVLLETHQGNPEIVSRFIEEAQIGGQLQHPGIAPVYELGTFPDPDRRPYFAMKLVRGQTLAALLAERKDRVGRGSHDPALPATECLPPAPDDLHRFLAIFEQVCQTMAYAHARGVIHRDLKPSNVMVGNFGEVQVMDWGLAKVLPRGGIADEASTQAVKETVVMTLRSGSSGSGESQAGSVLGTPAYMAPEQARGELGRVNERADVFGLGAILCEILTGRPPFIGSTREEIRHTAARGDLTDALSRLDASAAGADLVELAQGCLATEPHERPRNAGEVARRLSAYLAGVQERLRTAELARVQAQARATEERKRRLLSVALSASLLVTATVIAGGWTYLAQKRAERLLATTRLVNDALSKGEQLLGQARSARPIDLTSWSSAMAAATRARDLSEQGESDADLRARIQTMIAVVMAEQAVASQRVMELVRDRELLADLEAIRARRSEHWETNRTDEEYAAAFRSFGIDLDHLEPTEAGKRIAGRSDPAQLVSYVDDWAMRRRSGRNQGPTSWRRLLATATVADRDPWRAELRNRIIADDRAALRRMAAAQQTLATKPVRTVLLLAEALNAAQETALCEEVLKQAWRLAPGDFWVNFQLGHLYADSNASLEDAIRFYSMSVGIRPRSFAAHNNLGLVLFRQERFDESAHEFREALRIQPNAVIARSNLGSVLHRQGKLEEAYAVLHEAIKLDPNDAPSYFTLGNVLTDIGRFDGAIAEFRHALRIAPSDVPARLHLAIALHKAGKWAEESAIYGDLLQRDPNNTLAHANYGVLHRRRGQFIEAIADFRKALELTRKDPGLAKKFQQELTATEQLAAAAERLRQFLAGKLQPRDTSEIMAFADICHRMERYSGSVKLFSRAFQEQPKLADDMNVQNRYSAACAAALAGLGQGKDDPPADDAKKTHWRKQAIDWLWADLAAWSKILASGPPQAKQSIAQTLQHWKADTDLAGLRDAAALAKLSAGEQKACRELWAEVDALLAKAQGTNHGSGH